MKSCFIIMPITTPAYTLAEYGGDKDHFMHVLEHLFKPGITAAELQPIPPIAKGADIIHGEIVRNLENADLELCDMSTLNANVLFELGIRIALDKPVCLVKDDKTPDVPFDGAIVNRQTYSSDLTPWLLEDEISRLTAHLGEYSRLSDISLFTV